ncbi:MAG: response regulator [Anaerolineae bacterium]
MITESVEQELRDVLAHLYDPDHRPSDSLYHLVGCQPQDGPAAVQSAIIEAIHYLEPPAGALQSSLPWQIYDLLRNRFLLDLTLEQTAERMHMSVSTTWRRQRAAVHALGRALWQRSQAQHQPQDDGFQRTERPTDVEEMRSQAADWRSQAKRELASLRASSSDTLSDVGETICHALEVTRALASRHNVRLEVGAVQSDLIALIHPSVLRQMLITAIGRLIRCASTDRITVFARLEDGDVRITLTGTIAAEDRPSESEIVRDILRPENTDVKAALDGNQVFVWMELPSSGRSTVLVVDDNSGMVRFYRRSTEGTSYRIVHVAEGQRLFETIQTTAPDLIVLDVMLPDVDGWELLIRLHEDPKTRPIPVVVCTVVREEELALSLGAVRCLTKPIRPDEFRQTLDAILGL